MFVTEPSRQIPVGFEVDVVVCGGGTAGVAAAVCAAREGLSVVLIERSSILGGMVTHVTSWLNDFDNKGGFPREFQAHLLAEGIESKPYYNPWRVVPYLDALVAQSGVRVLYLATAVAPILDGNRLDGVFVESKSGRTAVRAKVTIDATGDGDIAARSGAAFEQGRDGDGAVQAISITQALLNYQGGKIGHERMTEIIAEAVAKSGKPYWHPYNRWHPALVVGTAQTLFQSVPHATGYDPTDAVQLSDALVEMRRQSNELFALLQRYAAEFEGIEYGPFSAIPGVRESRRIVCDKTVTKEHVLTGAHCEDGLFTVVQNIDIHRRDRVEAAIVCVKVKPYHLPYGALLPRGLENLLVVGRCIGGDHEALASYRIIANCMAMGEAAAVAARCAIGGECSLRGISVPALVAEMAARGYER
jgi:hypothetical protein